MNALIIRSPFVLLLALTTGFDACEPTGDDDDSDTPSPSAGYALVDTGQDQCFSNGNEEIECPQTGSLSGQDASYHGRSPSYTDNGDGTVTDNVTGLMWQQTPEENMSWEEAIAGASSLDLAGYSDWRLPTIKELYTLIDFSGATGKGDLNAPAPADAVPYIDTSYFDFSYGDTSAGDRYIDAQYWSSTEYVSTTMNGNETVFGVNFADGRIKGYPKSVEGNVNYSFVRYVRGGQYGQNDFTDNGDSTVTDNATGLTWMQGDSGTAKAGSGGDGTLDWEEALAWCEGLEHAGKSDWRLPNAKEMQSIVDYTRSPDTTRSAAIDPVFTTTMIEDEGGNDNWPFFWTSTTHQDGPDFAVYIAFGEALGCMESPPNSGNKVLMDVHGAGAQRSDPKSDQGSEVGCGNGPQGDVLRIYNFARCVRGGM